MIYKWWRQTEKYKQWSEYTFTPRKRKTQSPGRKTGNSGCGCPPETRGENPGPEPNKGRSSFYTGPTLGDAKTRSWLLRQALNFYFVHLFLESNSYFILATIFLCSLNFVCSWCTDFLNKVKFRNIKWTILKSVQFRDSRGEVNGNPLQYSWLENPTDRGAWRAAVHRVAKSQTWLKGLSVHTLLFTAWEGRELKSVT